MLPKSVFEYDPSRGHDVSAQSVVQESEGSFKNMLATQPPVVIPPKSIFRRDYSANAQEVHRASDGYKALIYGRLVERAASMFGYCYNDRQFNVRGVKKWAVLKKTVDDITGYEMLQIIADGYAASDKLLFFL